MIRRFFSICFLIPLTFILETKGFAEGPPAAKMGSSIESSSEIPSIKKYEKPTPASSKPTIAPPPSVTPTQKIVQHATYLHPGILVYQNGKWEGGDHLFNLSNNIGLYIKLIKPEDETLEITEEMFQKEAESIFMKANIKPLTLADVNRPPLPAFEIEVFIYPIDKGYTAFIEGRLFESVVLERFKMDANMAFQAITWEKQSLIVTPKEKLSEELTRTVQEISEAFATQFQAYDKLKRP